MDKKIKFKDKDKKGINKGLIKKIILIIVGIALVGCAGYLAFINVVKPIITLNKVANADWDYYVANNDAGVSFRINKNKTLKLSYKDGTYPDQEGKFTIAGNNIIVEFYDETTKATYYPYILHIDGDHLCVGSDKCDQESGLLVKRDSKQETTTTTERTTNVNAPTIYIFHGDGCPHCKELIDWIDKEESLNSVNIIKYEVWNDTANSELMTKVAKKLKKDVSAVPFVVIGNKVISGFDSNQTPDEIKSIVNDYVNNPKNYKDVVSTVK